MVHHENFQNSVPTSAEVHHVNENVVQAALIKMWADKQGDALSSEHNAAALAWIKSGMAAKFRDYIEKYGDEEINTDDEEKLAELLEALNEPTVH